MSVNKVILLGRLGKDPDVRYTNDQKEVVTLSLATSERRKDPSGEWVEKTEWHRIVAFGRLAEVCSKYTKKGKELFVEGSIRTNKWQDKEGKDRYTTEVIANNIQFVGPKDYVAGAPAGGDPQSQSSSNGKNILDSLPTADAIQKSNAQDVTFEDDDIPF